MDREFWLRKSDLLTQMFSFSPSFASRRAEPQLSPCTAWALAACVGRTEVSGCAPRCDRDRQTSQSAAEGLYWERFGQPLPAGSAPCAQPCSVSEETLTFHSLCLQGELEILKLGLL